jgi:2-polyprenyl-3-methyl-5-hydroxy-6-metoxy-1,4-benzoquinol methylase
VKTMEERKAIEVQFHNKLRDPALREDPKLYSRLVTVGDRWYSITRQSAGFTEQYLRQRSPGARALDFACGNGHYALLMAEAGADVTGIDLSEVSVQNAEREAAKRGLPAKFEVMDCEAMTFPNSTFDLISVTGVLHHLDLERAYAQLARVLKPTGSVLCVEGLAHNPFIHGYRKLTPHLRTAFEVEHILRRKDVFAARKYFRRIDWRLFYLASIAATPFYGTAVFRPVLTALESVDSVLLKVPGLRWWAWQVAFVLSEPIR